MEKNPFKLVKCIRCGYEWYSKITPKQCARCRSPAWNKDYVLTKKKRDSKMEAKDGDKKNKE